jgi:sRNA-binding protein
MPSPLPRLRTTNGKDEIAMRTIPREQIEDTIRYLATLYPKAFFVERHLKRPLTKNILRDLEKDRVLVDDDRREAAINYYTQDWNYLETIVAGAKRVDLHGHEVGTVTMQEQLETQRKLKALKDELRERRKAESIRSPIEVARRLHANGKIPTDSLSKIPAPPLENPPMTKAKTPEKTEKTTANDLAQLRSLWSNIDNNVLSHTEDANLHSALVAPALKVFVAEANKLIMALESNMARMA